MREVEESNQKKQQAAAVAAQQQRQQQEQQQLLAQRQVTVATIPQVTHATAIAIKSEPHVTADPQQHHIIQHQQPQIQQQIIEEPRDVKPNIAAVNAANAVSKGEAPKPVVTTPKPSTSGATPTSQTRTYNRSQPRTQIMPRLQLLDDEDDGLTCRLCLQAFWYRGHLNDHLKEAHSIADPTKYEREEREKKLRRIREEQQRMAMSKRQRLMQMSGRGGAVRGRGGMMMRGRGGLRPGMPGRPMPTGPRPSFQYRDGAFICDLCKKSFSDGNDMVAHWKSHVKQQAKTMKGNAAASAAASAREQRLREKELKKKMRGKNKTHLSQRGRPISKKSAGRKGKKKQRKDKGKPRWTAYLLWSTRRRKEIAQENPEYTFAQVGKAISEGWKEVEKEKIEQLKEEAEHLNSKNVKKLPKVKDGSGSEDMTDYSEEEDPTFDETNLKKPITERLERQLPERKSGRKQKRPSFFQEFEEEEDNLDKILDDFELEQIEEAKNPDARPKPKPKPKNPGSKPRKRREPSPGHEEEDEEVELETSRSGRVRKKTKFYDYFNKEGGEEEVSGSDESEDDDFNPEAEGEMEEPEEEFDPKSGSESEGEGAVGDSALPPKKRKARPIDGKEGEPSTSEDNADNVNASKLSQETMKDIDLDGEKLPVEDLMSGEPQKPEEPKEESETAKEAKEHGLSDEKEAMAAMALPLEEIDDAGTQKEVEPEAEKESTKAPLEEEVSLQTPRPEAPSETKEESSMEVDTAVSIEPDNAVVEDDNAGGLDGSVTEETPNDENPLGDSEEAILTSATEKMEEGDEQYKNELAESQMDNIFN